MRKTRDARRRERSEGRLKALWTWTPLDDDGQRCLEIGGGLASWGTGGPRSEPLQWRLQGDCCALKSSRICGMRPLTRSKGAVHVFDRAPATPPAARSCRAKANLSKMGTLASTWGMNTPQLPQHSRISAWHNLEALRNQMQKETCTGAKQQSESVPWAYKYYFGRTISNQHSVLSLETLFLDPTVLDPLILDKTHMPQLFRCCVCYRWFVCRKRDCWARRNHHLNEMLYFLLGKAVGLPSMDSGLTCQMAIWHHQRIIALEIQLKSSWPFSVFTWRCFDAQELDILYFTWTCFHVQLLNIQKERCQERFLAKRGKKPRKVIEKRKKEKKRRYARFLKKEFKKKLRKSLCFVPVCITIEGHLLGCLMKIN